MWRNATCTMQNAQCRIRISIRYFAFSILDLSFSSPILQYIRDDVPAMCRNGPHHSVESTLEWPHRAHSGRRHLDVLGHQCICATTNARTGSDAHSTVRRAIRRSVFERRGRRALRAGHARQSTDDYGRSRCSDACATSFAASRAQVGFPARQGWAARVAAVSGCV